MQQDPSIDAGFAEKADADGRRDRAVRAYPDSYLAQLFKNQKKLTAIAKAMAANP